MKMIMQQCLCVFMPNIYFTQKSERKPSQNAFILLDQLELKYGLFVGAVAHILNFFLPLKYA